jgi:hypothetical protein
VTPLFGMRRYWWILCTECAECGLPREVTEQAISFAVSEKLKSRGMELNSSPDFSDGLESRNGTMMESRIAMPLLLIHHTNFIRLPNPGAVLAKRSGAENV